MPEPGTSHHSAELGHRSMPTLDLVAKALNAVRATAERCTLIESDSETESDSEDEAASGVEDEFLPLDDMARELDKLDEDGLYPYERLEETFEQELAGIGESYLVSHSDHNS